MDFLEKIEIDPEGAKRDFIKTGFGILKTVGTVATLLNPPTTVLGIAGMVAKSEILDVIEDLAVDGSFKYYGNYGGPGYSSGRKFIPGQTITKKDLEVMPIDGLDKIFKDHDLRYQRSATHNDPLDRAEGLKDADHKLLKELSTFLDSPEATLWQKTNAYLALQAFRVKLATGLGYNVSQLRNPDARKIVDEYFGDLEAYKEETKDFVDVGNRLLNIKDSFRQPVKNIEIQKQVEPFYYSIKGTGVKIPYVDELDELDF